MSNIHVPIYKLEPDDLIEDKKPANDEGRPYEKGTIKTGL